MHRRLYDHYRGLAAPLPDSARPLFLAVVCGCNARLFRQALHEVYIPRIQRDNASFAANPSFATGAVGGPRRPINTRSGLEGLHYGGYAGKGSIWRLEVIRGGGCGGSSSPSWASRSFWVLLGAVWRRKIKVRPSVVGKWTSSICMALSCSKTERGVRPGALSAEQITHGRLIEPHPMQPPLAARIQ